MPRQCPSVDEEGEPGTLVASQSWRCMSRDSLAQQADRAEALAAQTADEEVRHNLLEAARDYRRRLKSEPFEPKPGWDLPKEIS